MRLFFSTYWILLLLNVLFLFVRFTFSNWSLFVLLMIFFPSLIWFDFFFCSFCFYLIWYSFVVCWVFFLRSYFCFDFLIIYLEFSFTCYAVVIDCICVKEADCSISVHIESEFWERSVFFLKYTSFMRFFLGKMKIRF